MNGISQNVAQEHPDCLRDESRKTGSADSVGFPKDEQELIAQLKYAAEKKLPVTVQGARTGITGGAVPFGGHVVNLSRMNKFLRVVGKKEGRAIVVQPGILLEEARKVVAESLPGWFIATDPTEASASLGGMVACNASGARSFAFGAIRNFVERLRIVLVDGSVLDLARGQVFADGRRFEVVTQDGRKLGGALPGYRMPSVKNAAGFFAADGMDLLDLFIGSEGTLGIFTEIELRLTPLPGALCGIMVFMADEKSAVEFVRDARVRDDRPIAIEFFDADALGLLRGQKERNPAFSYLPEMPPKWNTAVYVEYAVENEAALDARVETVCDMMGAHGGDPADAWLATDARELERMKKFRHAVPEAVNLTIDERRKTEPQITKLGTDLAVPDDCLERTLGMYRSGLSKAGLQSVMFGHIGNNHLHVNIIPTSLEQYDAGKRLYLDWAREVVKMDGTVSAEHGIGKLKTEMLKVMYTEHGVFEMLEVKKVFDPELRLNRGNLFST